MGAWTVDEERMLQYGRVHAGLTAVAALQRCLKLGWKLTGELRRVDMTTRSHRMMYDVDTLQSIREGVVPAGLSLQGLPVDRTRMGIEFWCWDTVRERIEGAGGALGVLLFQLFGLLVLDICGVVG